MRYKYKRGPITWSPELAYVIGVIASDGNLSPDGRHINITSKDRGMIFTMKKLLARTSRIGKKSRGGETEKKYYLLQFSDVLFYDFLLSIGLTPAKSKTIGPLNIPTKYFPDFLRGCIDGDGSLGYFIHPESKLPQFRIRLASASPKFLTWVLQILQKEFHIQGGFIYHTKKSASTLSFGKRDARKILPLMYYEKSLPSLKRKRVVAEAFL